MADQEQRPEQRQEEREQRQEEREQRAAAAAAEPRGKRRGKTMIPGRDRRRLGVESAFMRLVATGGVVGIGVALGAILVGQDVEGWIVGLAVSLTTVVLSAVLWSSRQL
jgi:Flp pilus assembly protein TadB